MNENGFMMAFAFASGIGLGVFFFAGLRWTVRKVISAKRPARLFLGSLLLRMSITLTGFYLVSDGHWQRLLLCLFGFFVARWAVLRLSQLPVTTCAPQETTHAP